MCANLHASTGNRRGVFCAPAPSDRHRLLVYAAAVTMMFGSPRVAPTEKEALMAVTAELLRELHRIHCQLADLRERLDRGPRQVRAREANVANLQQQLATAQDNVKQTRMAADQKQLDLKTGENKIEDLRGKLNACSTNKEFHALQEQIAAAEMANSVLADEILEALEKVDLLDVASADATKVLGAGTAELKKCQATVVGEADTIRGDIERLEGELIAAEKQLPSDFRDDYRRVIRAKAADGMTAAEGRTCTGCGQQMTLNMQNDLALSKPIFCKACGRLLYVAEA